MTQLKPEQIERWKKGALVGKEDWEALCGLALFALRGEPVATDTQNARFAIDGAIAFGMRGINKPPEGHWLMEYWEIGRMLAAPQPSPAEAVRKGLRLAEREVLEDDGISISHVMDKLDDLPDAELLERAGGV